MNGPSSDRNLLLGIVALQMDFISRDALIEAMHAWTLDKARSLSEILVEERRARPSRSLGAGKPGRAAHRPPRRRAAKKPVVARSIDPSRSPASRHSTILIFEQSLSKLARVNIDELPDTDPERTGPGGQPEETGGRFRIINCTMRGARMRLSGPRRRGQPRGCPQADEGGDRGRP